MTERPTRVLHLVGSAVSDELDDLSRLYAADALAALTDPAYEHVVARVEPDGRWSFPADLSRDALASAPRTDTGAAVAHLADLAPDVALPQMFCVPGMTTYRSLLSLLGLPFVGNTAEVMALGAHKQHARALVTAAGVGVPRGEVVRAGGSSSLVPPVVVKPVSADNSAGVTLVGEGAGASDLDAALATAWALDDEALVEEFVPLGREVRCGVLERDGRLVALPVEEYAVDPVTKPVRDAADKLRRDDDGALHLVAKGDAYAWIVPPGSVDPAVDAVQAAALACFTALGCRHYGLFDFRIDPEGRPWFLEAGLYCSYAEQSVLVAMGRAAGLDVRAMFAEGVALALGT